MAPKRPPNQVSEIVNINPTQVPHRALHGLNMAEIHCAFFVLALTKSLNSCLPCPQNQAGKELTKL